MYTLKSFKRIKSIWFTSILCFGFIMAMGLTSCQSAGQNQVNHQNRSIDNPDSVQVDTVADNQNLSTPDQNLPADENAGSDKTDLVTNSHSENLAISDKEEADIESDGNTDDSAEETSRPKPSLSSPQQLYNRSSSDQNAHGLSPKEVKQALHELNEIMKKECPPRKGILKMSFVIHNSGKADEIEVIGGSIMGTKSEDCIIEQLSQYQFQKFEGPDVSIKYPFTFK